jgi:hypothetical protein
MASSSFGSFGVLPQAGAAPTALPAPIGAVSVYTPEPPSAPHVPVVAPLAVTTISATPQLNSEAITFATVGRPANNDGVSIPYLGEKWVSSGPAVPITPESFRVVGSYEGFPVFARKDGWDQVIYVPTRAGLAAPYRLKQ